MTDAKWREIVCLATRKVVEEMTREPIRPTSVEFGLGDDFRVDAHCQGRTIINYEGVIRRAGLGWGVISDIQMTLEEGGYYDSVPYLAPCRAEHIDAIAAKVKGFTGQGRWQPSSAHCKAFVSQFPPKLRPLLNTAFAQQFELLHPDTAAAHLVGAISALRGVAADAKRLLVTGLSPDSGNMIRMFFDHYTRGKHKDVTVAKDLHEALSEATLDDVIVLCDDNVGSGSQAQAQFRSWMNIPRNRWPTPQQKEGGIYRTALSTEEQEKFKKLRLGIAICAGKKSAEEGLKKLLADELHFLNFLGLYLGQDLDDRPKTHIPENLYKFLKNVGAEVLAHYRQGKALADLDEKTQQECLEDGAGYGDAQWLLATPYNVPTSTFTALWCPGMYQGRPWFPLLIRRGHLKELIVT